MCENVLEELKSILDSYTADGPRMSELNIRFRTPATRPHSFLFSTEEGLILENETRNKQWVMKFGMESEPLTNSLQHYDIVSDPTHAFFPTENCDCPSCWQFKIMNFQDMAHFECPIVDLLLHSGFNHLLSLSNTLTWKYLKDSRLNMGQLLTVVRPLPEVETLSSWDLESGIVVNQVTVNFNDEFMLHILYLCLLTAEYAQHNFMRHFDTNPELEARVHFEKFKKSVEFLFSKCVFGLHITVKSSPGCDSQYCARTAYSVLLNYKCTKNPAFNKKIPKEKLGIRYRFVSWFIKSGFKFEKLNSPGLLM